MRAGASARTGSATLPLAVGAAAAAAALALAAPTGVLGDVARAVTFVSTLAATGLCVFARAVHDRAGTVEEDLALRRAILACVFTGVLAGFAGLAIEVADVSGRGLAGATDATSWRIVVQDGSYASMAVRSLGLAFLGYVAAARWRAPTAGPLLVFGMLLACAWSAVTGHPVTHGPQPLARGMAFLHVAAGAVWFGGLIGLGIAMRHRRRSGALAGGAAIVRRFSRLMTGTVAALLTGGVAMTWFFLGAPGRLTSTTYGLVLLGKVALVLALLAVAGFNRRRLVPAVQAGEREGWRTLGRTVLFEQAALVAVLAVTAVLVNLDPQS